MLKKYALLVLLTFFFLSIKAQQKNLSAKAEISVLTIGAGKNLNDAFGHSAFRIKDPVNRFDIIFDYGRFDFNAPNFYLNFVKGKLNYALGSNNFQDFLQYYIQVERSVKEQVLNLTQDEKQKLFNFLLNNYKPENRYYLYEFFFDNCATKIRDVIQETQNNTVTFNATEVYKNESFRALIHGNLIQNSWECFGIDLALGAVIDKQAKATEHMFLPKHVFTFLNGATTNASQKKLVKQSHTLNKAPEKQISANVITSPLVVLTIIGCFIIYLTYIDYKKNTRTRWLDISLFTITGLTGLVILLLWFATNHLGTKNNYNLLWAFTGNLFVIFQLLKTKSSLWFIGYLKLLIIMLCLLTMHWVTGVQCFNISLLPFLIALCFRYVFLVYYYQKQV